MGFILFHARAAVYYVKELERGNVKLCTKDSLIGKFFRAEWNDITWLCLFSVVCQKLKC
jgi:hypothetical protein